jgi:hypothetical protein
VKTNDRQGRRSHYDSGVVEEFNNGTFGLAAPSDHFRDSTKMVRRVVIYWFIRLYGSPHGRLGKISSQTLARDNMVGGGWPMPVDRIPSNREVAHRLQSGDPTF